MLKKLPLIGALMVALSMTEEVAAAGNPQVALKTSMGEIVVELDAQMREIQGGNKTNALVTGEKDLLALSHSFAVPILAPAAFRDRMQPKAKK